MKNEYSGKVEGVCTGRMAKGPWGHWGREIGGGSSEGRRRNLEGGTNRRRRDCNPGVRGFQRELQNGSPKGGRNGKNAEDS